MLKRLGVIVILVFFGCSNNEKFPACFNLKYKMSKDEAEIILGEKLLIQKDGKDFKEYTAGKCNLVFFEHKNWLVEAEYKIFRQVTEVNCKDPNVVCD